MSFNALSEFKAATGSRTSPPGYYEQMTDRVAATTANDTIGQVLLDGAYGVLLQKLAGRLALPVTDAALLAWLKRAEIIIAQWDGWTQHPKLSKNRETIKDAYMDLMKMLAEIAAGTAQVPSSETGSAAAAATAVGDERVFTMESMEGL